MMDYEDFADYMIRSYPNAKKIIEVGVGRDFQVLNELRNNFDVELIATDLHEGGSNGVLKDDVLNPDMSIYKGADLIYSIRPPPELNSYIIKIARSVGADVIIKPMQTEALTGNELKLVNYKRATFYLGSFRKDYIVRG